MVGISAQAVWLGRLWENAVQWWLPGSIAGGLEVEWGKVRKTVTEMIAKLGRYLDPQVDFGPAMIPVLEK